MTEARHLVIHGRVQGVSFRYSMACEAQRLGVAGWVRNRREGTVEAVLVGAAAAVAALMAGARHGPSLARVERIEVELPAAELRADIVSGSGFQQRSDAG